MRRLVIVVIFLALMSGCVNASMLEERERSVQSAIPEDAQALMDGEHGSFGAGLRNILENLLPSLSESVRSALRSIGVMLAALILCALAGAGETLAPALIAGTVAITACGMLELHSLAQSGQQALMQLQSFSDLLLPAMAAATAAGGGVTASGAIYAGTAFFSDVLMRAMTGLLIPVLYAYVAMCAAQAVCGNDLLSRLSGLIRWVFQTGLKTILFVFTAYLTITGLISGSADATVLKAAKLTLSGVVPVVGSMISDASETVIVGAQSVKSSVGIVGMLAVIAICVSPFVRIGVQYLLMKLAAAAGGALGPKPLLGLMDSIGEAMGFLLAMTGTAALMLLISCVCYLRVTPV